MVCEICDTNAHVCVSNHNAEWFLCIEHDLFKGPSSKIGLVKSGQTPGQEPGSSAPGPADFG